jgi:hypothetical protein
MEEKMHTLKQEALNAISNLPESANLDDIMYRLYVIDKVKKAQESISQEDGIPTDDLLKEIESW